MKAIILGSAAGGGVPQWNCACPVCRLAWAGDPRVRPRTQSSLAVSANGADWLLLNASPDIRSQILATPALHPREGRRHSPIRAVLLTNGDVDHLAGLLTLRERQAFGLYATADILDGLAGNPVFGVLDPAVVGRHAVALDTPVEPLPGLVVTLFAVPGKVPLWQEGEEPEIGQEGGTTVGALVSSGGARLAYIPGCAAVTEAVRRRVADVDALLFDGTVMHDDDLFRSGTGSKTGWRMGHVAMLGETGSIGAFADLPIGRKIFVHLNNTNPVLVDGSAEQELVRSAGWTVAQDGMMLEL